jgi:ATP-dependent Clp protease ATP-binding subunit ClpC
MNIENLKKILKPWQSTSLLERNFPHSTRLAIKNTFGILALAFLALSSGLLMDTNDFLTGIFFLVLSVWLVLVMTDAYFYSVFSKRSKEAGRFAFLLSEIIFGTPSADITWGFFKSSLGREIMNRCGIDNESLGEFLATRKFKINSKNFTTAAGRSVFKGYIEGLLESDGEFKNFILSHNVTEGEFIGASIWSATLAKRKIDKKMWWKKERLMSVRGIGKDWSYGRAYLLARYGRPLTISEYIAPGFHAEEAKMLELALLRGRESNALLVGDDGVGKMEVLEELARQIKTKKADPSLSSYKFTVFDLGIFSSAVKNGEQFSGEFGSLLAQVSRSGNIVLVIPNLSALVKFAESIGSDILPIITPLLKSADLHVVAISETRDYEKHIEPLHGLREHFEMIRVHPADEDSVISLLQDFVGHLEKEGFVVTYPAVSGALRSAKQYFLDSPLVDTAEDLLIEAAEFAAGEGRRFVLKEDVLEAAEKKSGVPAGVVNAEEKEKLLNLETLLHDRIIGQNEAIKTISDAVRRARSGINSGDRPLGSFLFLGPTGVGKTETAKALAEVFFGQDARILRLDMSEYRAGDSLERLIGDAGSGNPGALSGMLREHQFGVLLLDEFEKTSLEVMDLFLQILDEGIFSDMRGEPVSARNVIIIATSNAGSGMIFDMVKQGRDPAKEDRAIIEELVKNNIFKAELLNRFDGVIVFHPLSDENLSEVARLQLKKLAWRLKAKGLELVINESLVSFIAAKGKDPEFGARPLNRAIADTVEQDIAKRLISGEIKPGNKIEFNTQDLRKI